MAYDFDAIVIGAGAGGLTVARGLNAAKKKVLLIEKGAFGGDCTNVGCVPSKALLDYVFKNPRCGLGDALRFAREKRDAVRTTETAATLTTEGIHVVVGTAQFSSNHSVVVDGKTYTARNSIVSTGSRPLRIAVPGVPAEKIITNEEFFDVQKDLKSIVILGGGYIGCELAEACARAGVLVTVLQREERLVPREEPTASEYLLQYFKGLGIKVYLQSSVTSANEHEISFTSEGKEEKTEYDAVLLALGRTVDVSSLALDTASVTVKKGIVVDAYNRTSCKHIYAIGDCVDGNPQFTHVANNEGRQVVRNILFPYVTSSYRKEPIPSTLYTHLEIAKVGLTEADALTKFSSTAVGVQQLSFEHNDRALVTDTGEGCIKLIYTKPWGRIIGGTIVSEHAGEILPRLTSAIRARETVFSVSRQIFGYPTRADLLKRTADRASLSILLGLKNEVSMLIARNTTAIIAFVFWLLLVSLFGYVKFTSGLTILGMFKEFLMFSAHNPIAPLVYIVVYALRPLIFFPATLLTFSSSVLFGPFYGFLYTMIGENMSANIAYVMGRVFGKSLFRNAAWIESFRERIGKDLFRNLLIARFIFLPFDMTNYASGILRLRWKTYAITTALGIIPGVLVFVLAGASVDMAQFVADLKISINTKPLLISGIIFALALYLSKYLKRAEIAR